MYIRTLANMTLVFATSRGVVMAAAVPPAIAPHTAPCHGSRGEPCNLLHVDYNIIIMNKVITTLDKLNSLMHFVFLIILYLKKLPQWVLGEREGHFSGDCGEIATIQSSRSLCKKLITT